MKLKDFDLDETRQYYFPRDLFCVYFEKYAPSFIDYMWESGSNFTTENFSMFRREDEFYLLHINTGILLNWYKHLGRTNTCNIDIDLKVLKELLLTLESDIKEKINDL